MRLFKKRERPSPLYPFLQRLGACIERCQRNCADRLNSRTAGWSRLRMKWLLFIFCFAFGSASLYTGIRAISYPSGKLHIDKVAVPSHVLQPEDAGTVPAAVLSDTERQRFQAFSCYLDSLAQDSEGKRIFDSIRRERPGLLDSLRWVESIYGYRAIK